MESAVSTKKPHTKRVLAPEPDSRGHGTRSPTRRARSDKGRCVSKSENWKNELRKCDSQSQIPESNKKPVEVDNGKKKLETTLGTKRKAEHDFPIPKRLNMDGCYHVLKKLMDHKNAQPFIKPLEIFSIPMDLGTVESKLKENAYTEVEAFGSDVRLTFSNAMRYYPPSNQVYQMAEELNKLFVEYMDAAIVNRQSRETKLPNGLKDEQKFNVVDSLTDVIMPSDKLNVASLKDVRSNINIMASLTDVNMPSDKVNVESSKDVPSRMGTKAREENRTGSSKVSSMRIKPRDCQSLTDESQSRDLLLDCQSLTDEQSREHRAEILKKRFAATIHKAQRETILHLYTNTKLDSMEVQQEIERLEQRRREDIVRIEAEMKASKIKQETELKNQRQREREAARLALEKMERSVEIVDNAATMKEFAMLIGDYTFVFK